MRGLPGPGSTSLPKDDRSSLTVLIEHDCPDGRAGWHAARVGYAVTVILQRLTGNDGAWLTENRGLGKLAKRETSGIEVLLEDVQVLPVDDSVSVEISLFPESIQIAIIRHDRLKVGVVNNPVDVGVACGANIGK